MPKKSVSLQNITSKSYSRKCIWAVGLHIQNISQAAHRQTFYSCRHYTSVCIFTQFRKKKLRRKTIAQSTKNIDFENTDDGTVIEGEWRREIQNDSGMLKLAKIPRNHGNDAKKIRDTFLDYFMSNEGRVSWQDKYL